MSSTYHFQSIILNLQKFWHEQGCLIWQPYYTQVGAGTYNPSTFLRVLGPEPWNVAYLEPSVRPDDGRYGDNPYRLQQHLQFQVILKPDPGNPQELYLRSLMAIGIDPSRHDIRFVEDNWESPALGAWGLGWEVWLDGQEITQFTYFQQAGGMQMDPVSVEITYGLERIAMPLQRVRHFKNLKWSPDRTYGDVYLKGEYEHSKYYFEDADIENTRQMYELYEKEALNALDKKLVMPAFDYILKCSHTFNILDTRGAVGVTERQDLFRRMRDVARKVAELYVEQRQEMEYPWLESEETIFSTLKDAAIKSPAGSVNENDGALTDSADFLFEIGTEELPAADFQDAIDQLNKIVADALEQMRLEHKGFTVYGTPRRLVVLIKDLAAKQADLESEVKGPPADRAFDKDGNPTKAAIGFAKSKGLDVSDLVVKELDGGNYVSAVVFESGKSSIDVLKDELPQWIKKIQFRKTMRWNDSGISFSRPIRWLLAMHGGSHIPMSYAGINSNAFTRGLRFIEPEIKEITSIEAYFEHLKAQGILLSVDERKKTIEEQTRKLSEEVGGDGELDQKLLDEVTYLVEAPQALRGTFEEERLDLPEQVLISVMKKHQRYFPIRSKKTGKLLPYFITIRNGGSENLDVVRDGNELVIKARFSDAAFFIKEDLKRPLEAYLERLSTLLFHVKLGSMLDKSQRIEGLVGKLLPELNPDAVDADKLQRAAKLCKADLVTNMVVEMTSLQGVMGKFYAQKSGEDEAVANAIYEHYLPASAGDKLPESSPGLVLGVADRLDSLSGLFAAGMAPSGTKDPFALRRTAIGLIITLIEKHIDLDVRTGLKMASEGLPVEMPEKVLNECLDFVIGRLRTWLLEIPFAHDVVEAVLAAQGQNPFKAYQAAEELSKWIADKNWHEILPTYSRCVRITRDLKEIYSVNPDLFEDDAEKALYQALEKAEAEQVDPGSVDGFFKRFLPIMPAINTFFDSVLVMAEDQKLKETRLGMLQRIAALTDGIADFSRLEGF